MPTRHFLTASESLNQQVAGFIAEAVATGRIAVKDTLLVTPTGGAARSIARALKSIGLEVPHASQPMQAPLPQRDDVASPVEQSLAWSDAIQDVSERDQQALFWKREPQTLAERLKAGRNFCKLANLLAEAGHSPSTLQVPAQLRSNFDEGRWSAIASLHRDYLKRLEGWGLADPNELRLQAVHSPSLGRRHLVIAGVPDLPTIFERFCENLESGGDSTIDLLVWNPSSASESSFDPWGRPIPEIWNQREIEIADSQLHVAASARDEAHATVTHIVEHRTCGLVSADPKLNPLLAGEILSQGEQAYLPEGNALIRTEAAKFVLGWEEFCFNQDLRVLRRLAELPAFCRALDREHPISQSDALTAIDHLLGEAIASTLETAWAASPALPEDADPHERKIRGQVRRLLGAVRAQLKCSATQLLEAAFLDRERPDSVNRLLDLGQRLENSPALKGTKGIPAQIFTQAILAEQLQTPAPEGAITLNGWLEAPWLEDTHLVLCGLIEGQVPQSLDGDPFLPNAVRTALGLNCNDQRLARDAYLLSSLLAARKKSQTKISFSKYNHDGDPNRPSRLLLRTPLSELPHRVRRVARPEAAARLRPRRKTDWRWQLPHDLPPVEKIGPTAFEAYLSCPFRFCLEKLLHYDRGSEASHEMNAAVFGNLIHRTLENFSRAIIPLKEGMLQLSEQDIRNQVQGLLEDEALRLFGPQPAPAVRVQIANAATRLHAFARVQAECFAEGWFIIEAERKLAAESDGALQIGGLKLSGVIDRVDQQAQSGALRVMDYKTFSSLSQPAEKHIGPASHNWLPEAQVELSSGKPKTWKNLQLPLYRKILEHWYPDETATHRPETAYFVLPSDPNESGVYPFGELNGDGVYESALACAEAVAAQIEAGVFWPPQPFRGSWEDPIAPLLVNGAPEDSIHPDSIERLKGGTA